MSEPIRCGQCLVQAVPCRACRAEQKLFELQRENVETITWIPVAERLPEMVVNMWAPYSFGDEPPLAWSKSSRHVLAALDDETTCEAYRWWDYGDTDSDETVGKWSTLGRFGGVRVVAWAEMPKGPR